MTYLEFLYKKSTGGKSWKICKKKNCFSFLLRVKLGIIILKNHPTYNHRMSTVWAISTHHKFSTNCEKYFRKQRIANRQN